MIDKLKYTKYEYIKRHLKTIHESPSVALESTFLTSQQPSVAPPEGSLPVLATEQGGN